MSAPELTPIALKSLVAACFPNNDAVLPAKVFAQMYGNFKFLEYVEMSGEGFWALLRRMGTWSGDDQVAVVSFDPDYVATTGGRGGAFAMPLSADATEYYTALECPVAAEGGDVPFISLALAWAPPSRQWAIWGEAQLSTLVVGFREAPEPTFEEMARSSGLRPWKMEEILDLVKLDFGNYDHISGPPTPEQIRGWEEYAAEFRRNYSPQIRPGGK